jgi:allantoin racemase
MPVADLATHAPQKEDSTMVRIAYIIGDYPPEERRKREDVALSYSTPDIQVGIVSVKATPYIHVLSPAEVQLATGPFVEAFREAERQGYDAIVPLGTLDLGVDAGRSVVDIPVVGPFEAMLHVACLLGQRFGVIVYADHHIVHGIRSVIRYGMQDRIVGWKSSGVDLPDVAKNKDLQKDTFLASARELIEKNRADVILPMGITQCPVNMSPDWLTEQLGVPVVEGIGAPIRLAGLLAGLNLRHSRLYWPKSPSF